jgi:4-carboxymuconolactone decarboxylase
VARLAGISNRQAPIVTRLVYWFARRALTRMSGRAPDRIIEPARMYAYLPGLLRGYARLEQATGRLHRVDDRYRALAELQAAAATGCTYCIDLGSQIARSWGLNDDELLALSQYSSSPLFDEIDRLVLDYAAGMSRTPVEVSEDLFDRLRGHFDDAQLVELTHVIALENMRGRFNRALGITAAGFSDGPVCAVPAVTEGEKDR